jgi:hypothetical protein
LTAYPLLIARKIVIPQRCVHADDIVGRALRENRMNSVFRILDILFHKGDREDFLLFPGRSARQGRDTTMKERVEFLEDWGLERASVLFVPANV